MKTTYVLSLIITLSVFGCGSKNQKQNVTMEKKIIQEKNYPKTNNYPVADTEDSEMEEDFVRAANAYEKKELTALNAIITSRDWVVYNDNIGRPIKRNRIAVVTTKIEERCFLQHMFFQQDADGNSYGETYITDPYGWKEFDCGLKQ